jgi:hypothetical protein
VVAIRDDYPAEGTQIQIDNGILWILGTVSDPDATISGRIKASNEVLDGRLLPSCCIGKYDWGLIFSHVPLTERLTLVVHAIGDRGIGRATRHFSVGQSLMTATLTIEYPDQTHVPTKNAAFDVTGLCSPRADRLGVCVLPAVGNPIGGQLAYDGTNYSCHIAGQPPGDYTASAQADWSSPTLLHLSKSNPFTIAP